jgi:hypothetical protein
MEGSEEGGQALKVNNGGERSPKMLKVQGGRRVFIGGKKYGRWKQPTGQFGGKSGGAGLCAGRSGGPPDGSGEGPKMQSEHQFSGSAGLARSAAGWSGGKSGGTGPGAEKDSPKTK